MENKFLSGWKYVLPENKMTDIFDKIGLKLYEHTSSKVRLALTIPFATFDFRKRLVTKNLEMDFCKLI